MLTTAGEHRRRALYPLELHIVMSIEGTYRQHPEDRSRTGAKGKLVDGLAQVV